MKRTTHFERNLIMSCMANPVREDKCVFITYKGEAPVNEMISTRYVANRYLALKHWNRIVVDITEWRSRPTFLELSSLASNLSSELPSNTRVALVVRSNQVEQAKIIERVARNEGVSVAYFFEAREAKYWVQGRKPLEQENSGIIHKIKTSQ